jgi:hypothetical protein
VAGALLLGRVASVLAEHSNTVAVVLGAPAAWDAAVQQQVCAHYVGKIHNAVCDADEEELGAWPSPA